ncbi:hypothetical protein SEPCBS119000_005118 [Sporothrix epigloea]|uniref:Glutathione transferase omega-1 n=1 Tax=Sporothrix epigloea TaxID=1892477 RepID=A0ABP0DVV3_9PEZI
MNAYPVYSLTQNIPLLVTIGLPAGNDGDAGTSKWSLDADLKDQATLLRSELPVLGGDQVEEFSRYITADNVSGPVPSGQQAWRGRAGSQRYRFRVRSAGRTYYLPPRRARLPENLKGPESQNVVLHSPFSPLSPSCSLYPDGIIDSSWVQKHQEVVPSVFLCFFALTTDATTATLQDNKIKSDITAFRTAVQQSGYRSRVAVGIFVASASDVDAQERLENIRRGSNVDSKHYFAIPITTAAGAPVDELHRVAENMLTNVYTVAMDYYRELGRLTRKKRSRGSAPQPSVPPTSGTSQTLSLAGWHIRYDVKAAVLAEFRQETDAALRLLDQAYETLLGPEVLAGAIPHWSPRWNEARLLVDTLAIRSLRCLLLAGQYSAAVRRWTMYRGRLRDLLEARGRGTANYGWQAWEARWAIVMADLIQRVGVPELKLDTGSKKIFLLPERSMIAERLAPWEFLHHPGYWYRLAARHTAARRALAHAIPQDDRRPPDFSPASQIAHRAFSYDDYMCPLPHQEYPLAGQGLGFDYSAAIIRYLEAARSEFLRRGQIRMAAEVALECSREYLATQQWQVAVDLLAPLLTSDLASLWSSWLSIREELAWTLRAAVAELGHGQQRNELLAVIDWELLDAQYTPRANWSYDVSKSIAMPSDDEGKTVPASIKFPKGTPAPSCLSVAFVFRLVDGKAGDKAQAQLSIRSNAHSQSSPVVLEELCLHFTGSIKPIVLQHSATAETDTLQKQTIYSVVELEEQVDTADDNTIDDEDDENHITSLKGTASLILHPQTTLVFEMAIPLRTPGDARAVSASLTYRSPSYSLQLALPLATRIFDNGQDHNGGPTWLLPGSFTRAALPRAECQAIRILPRPPKLDIHLLRATASPELAIQFYTNEAIDLALQLANGEDIDASVKLDVIMESSGSEGGESDSTMPSFTLLVDGIESGTAPSQVAAPALSIKKASSKAPIQGTAIVRSVAMGHIKAGTTVGLNFRIPPTATPIDLDLTFRAVYHLVSDPATPITQQLVLKLSLSNPFEANYDLLPRLHSAPWPSLFDHDSVLPAVASDNASAASSERFIGLTQAWALVTRYASFAAEDLRVVDLDLVIERLPGVSVNYLRSSSRSIDELHDEEGEAGSGDGPLAIIKPQTMKESRFDLVMQKASLDDRSTVHLDMAFVIKWQRLLPPSGTDDTAAVTTNTTTLPVPQLSIFSTEPRVLASVAYSPPTSQIPSIVLTVAIENASNHFLTFGLSMEPSADFAFSGAKLTTVHVLPMSRRAATYRLVPLVRGAWIRPGLVVRDKYFQKVLRILPTEGMKIDKDGILIWVPPDAGEEEGDE